MAFVSTKVAPAGSTVTWTNINLTTTEIVSSAFVNSQFSSPQFLDAFVNGAGLQRGIAQSVASGSTTTVVTLPIAEPNNTYAVLATGTFSTTIGLFAIGKSTSTFTVQYTTVATGTQTFDWLLIR